MVKQKGNNRLVFPNGPAGERIDCTGDTLIIRFPSLRNVLCTSWLNGGYREDLTSVFNHQIPPEACKACHSGGSVRIYLEEIGSRLGLDPMTTSGLITRVEMKNTAVVTESFREVSVCAIVTAGIDKNGVRAGDPASYYENGTTFEPIGGTINIILLINANLPEYAMARAMVTATEAKAAALQLLMARSCYSTGIATGSGTDMIAIVSDPSSPLRLSDAGTHSSLGELIGKSVIRGTQSALERETGLSPDSQRDALVRLERYRVTNEIIWAAAGVSGMQDPLQQDMFIRCLKAWAKDSETVARVAAALHVVDETEWVLIPQQDAVPAVMQIMQDGSPFGERPSAESGTPLQCLTNSIARGVNRMISTGPGTCRKNRQMKRRGFREQSKD